MAKIYFVTGVNGIGKSTLLHTLAPMLDATFDLHDFDERGVPDNADADWRLSETVHWINLGQRNLLEDRSTIICGYSKLSEIEQARHASGADIRICLLDANPEIIASRIRSRYLNEASIRELGRTTGKTPEKFAQDNVWVSGKFREEALRSGYRVIDTTDLDPQGVADAVKEWIVND